MIASQRVRASNSGTGLGAIGDYAILGLFELACAEARVQAASDVEAPGACDLYLSAGDAYTLAAKLQETRGPQMRLEAFDGLSPTVRDQVIVAAKQQAAPYYHFSIQAYLGAGSSCAAHSLKRQIAEEAQLKAFEAIDALKTP